MFKLSDDDGIISEEVVYELRTKGKRVGPAKGDWGW